MRRLSDEVRDFIVQRIAVFERPSAIVESVRRRFGITIPRQAVEDYDPSKRPNILPRRKALHDETRAVFLRAAATDPEIVRQVRDGLALLAEEDESRGSVRRAAALRAEIARMDAANA